MNKVGRNTIDAVIADLEGAKETADTLQEEEQEKFDNLSEGLQQATIGLALEEAVNALGDAINAIEEAIGYLENAKG